jgi:polyisoprenoid-binding protein YceI
MPFTGKLNLHGLDRPVTGTAEIKTENEQVKILAKFKVKSSEFNINIPSFAGITVGDEIEIEVELNLAKIKT